MNLLGIAHELFQLLLWRVAATDWRAFIEFGPDGIVGISDIQQAMYCH